MRHRPPIRISQGLVNLSRLPQSQKKHCELAGHSHHRPLLAALATLLIERESPASEIRIRTERTEDVVGSGHKEPAQMIVAGFGDPELRGEGAGVRLPGTQAHIRTHRASLGEAGWVFDGKEEALGGEGTHPGDLGEQAGLRVALSGRLLDQAVQSLDLPAELSDARKDRGKSRPQLWGDATLGLRGEGVGPAAGKATAERSEGSSRPTRAKYSASTRSDLLSF